MGEPARQIPRLRVIEGDMTDEDKERRRIHRMESAIEALLEANAEKRRSDINADMVYGKLDEVHADVRHVKSWQSEHERKDDQRHQDLVATLRDHERRFGDHDRRFGELERASDRHEARLSDVPRLQTQFEEFETTQTRMQVDGLNRAIAKLEADKAAMAQEADQKIQGLVTQIAAIRTRSSDHSRAISPPPPPLASWSEKKIVAVATLAASPPAIAWVTFLKVAVWPWLKAHVLHIP